MSDKLFERRLSSFALFSNERGGFFIVKSSDKPEWSLPGGRIEKNESPRQAAEREVREEIGLEVSVRELLCVDYYPATSEKGERLYFVFYGGILTPKAVARMRLAPEELSAYKFVGVKEGTISLFDRMAKRFPHCLAALRDGRVRYLEEGIPI